MYLEEHVLKYECLMEGTSGMRSGFIGWYVIQVDMYYTRAWCCSFDSFWCLTVCLFVSACSLIKPDLMPDVPSIRHSYFKTCSSKYMFTHTTHTPAGHVHLQDMPS